MHLCSLTCITLRISREIFRIIDLIILPKFDAQNVHLELTTAL